MCILVPSLYAHLELNQEQRILDNWYLFHSFLFSSNKRSSWGTPSLIQPSLPRPSLPWLYRNLQVVSTPSILPTLRLYHPPSPTLRSSLWIRVPMTTPFGTSRFSPSNNTHCTHPPTPQPTAWVLRPSAPPSLIQVQACCPALPCPALPASSTSPPQTLARDRSTLVEGSEADQPLPCPALRPVLTAEKNVN